MLGVLSYHPDVKSVDKPGSANNPVTKDAQDALKAAIIVEWLNLIRNRKML